MAIFSFLWNRVSDRNNDLRQQLFVNYHTQLYKRKCHCYHYLGIIFLIETMIYISNYMAITILNVLKLSITSMCLIVRTDLITIYYITIFNIEGLLDNIGISTVCLVVCTYSRKVTYILLQCVTV